MISAMNRAKTRVNLWRSCAIGTVGLLAACTSFHASVPAGFAPLEDDNPFRAVTPDGVVYRVREADNEPRADLSFWRKALRKRMQDAGYLFVAEQPLKAGATPGYLIELAAPFGAQDYAYLVAVFVRGDTLTIVEATGELSRLRLRRKAIIKAIKQLRW